MYSRRRTLLLFVAFQALYALTSSGNVFRAPDEFEVYFQAEHLVDAGDISVPQTLAIRQPVIVDGRVVGSQSMFFGEIGRDGRPYAPYGPLVAILALPHHLLGRVIAAATGVPRASLPAGIAWLVLVGGITMLATATAGALTVAGFHRALLALGSSPRVAVTFSLMLGAATVLWPYSTSFFSEAWQAAAFTWAAVLLLCARTEASDLSLPATTIEPAGSSSSGGRRAWNRVLIASALLAVAGLTKMTSLVFAPAFVVAALVERSLDVKIRLKTALALAAGIVFAAAVHVAWNLHRFGRPFDFGYDWSETIPHLPARAFLASDIPRGLVVLLLSPGKSIVVWAPVVLVAALCFRQFWHRDRASASGVLVAAGSGLIFYAAYLFPEGGYAHGPRNLVPILPLMLLPVVCAGDLFDRQRLRALIWTCTIVGFGIALLATSVSYLEDQSLGGDLTTGARTVYYERIDPAPGRVWNRYRLDYLPFVATITSPGWLSATNLGQGPDYFPLHLIQARRQLSDGASIPVWFIVAWPAAWLVVLATSAAALLRSIRDQS